MGKPRTNRLTILQVGRGTRVGGAERVLWELATRLPAQRFEVRAWLAPDAGVDEFARALSERGIEVERVADLDSRRDWGGLLATWSRLRRLRPALLHLHHVGPAPDRHLTMLARAAGVRHLVITEYVPGAPPPAAPRGVRRDDLARADRVTAVCAASADGLVRDHGVRRERIRMVPNGADLPDEDAEAPLARQWRERFGASLIRPLWVIAARLEEPKGHAVLFDALSEIGKRGLEFTLAVAGDGPLRAELEQRSQALGMAARVHFLGVVEPIGPLLAAADAVVLPSRWEGLPLTLLEAMARLRPVIATPVGGIPELIEDGVDGRLVPVGDAMALAEALELAHRKPDRALRLGRSGGERVRRDYLWPAIVQGYEAVYDEVLGLDSFTPDVGDSARRRGGRA